MTTPKYKLLQIRAVQALKYSLTLKNDETGNLYTKDDLAFKLDVTKSLIDQIINGRRTFIMSKIEQIERITKIDIYKVSDPIEFHKIDTILTKLDDEKIHQAKETQTLMESNFTAFGFYHDLVQTIKSRFEQKYPKVLVEVRNTSQYVSINVYGDAVWDSIHKSNLHLLFFKCIKYKGEDQFKNGKIQLKKGAHQFKIEYMIPYARLRKVMSSSRWYCDLDKYLSVDNGSVTVYDEKGKQTIEHDRPVYKLNVLSKSEIESFGNLTIVVFEIQTHLGSNISF